MTDLRTQTPIFTIDGQPLPDTAVRRLVSMDLRSSVHEAGSTTLRFDDEDRELLDQGFARVGVALEVSFEPPDGSAVAVFAGTITGIGSIQPERGSTPQLEIVARDASHRLQAASRTISYLDRSVKDVVADIAGRHGMTAECVQAGTEVPYLLQTGTDHAFVSHLATMLGHEWFTTDDVLHFRPRPEPSDGPTLSARRDLLRFEAQYSGEHVPGSVTVHSWDPSQQQGVSGTSDLSDAPGATTLGSSAPLAGDQHGHARKGFGQDLTVATTSVRDGPEADALAASVARRLIGEGLRAEGTTAGNPKIRAGGFVTIEDAGSALSGAYYVTEVIHEFGEQQQVLTRFVSDGHRLEPSLGTTASTGALDGWAERGLVIAKVTNAKDPEKQGRVKLRFPSLGDDVESDWARVVVPGGGKERGLDLRPEVDDEVVVGFERGDPRSPFVLGGMFHAKAPPFDDVIDDRGEVMRRVLASRAGHAITLLDGDSDDERAVQITLADGKTKVMIGEDGITIEAAKDTPLALKTGSASLTLTKDEKLVVKAKEITLDSQGDLTLKAAKGASLKAGTGAKIDGGSAFEAKGAQAKLEGGAMATIKGGMVKIN
ncbi:MAG: hypothetical protein JJT89_16640 [Nitriliruptoraceae bacterium]|nr:hypothetical protein [Nitriliruptoraceae bacterium]